MSSLRKLVLASFKTLHRTTQAVFRGDERALVAARQQINENYRKNKDEKPEKVEELIKLAEGVDIELKSRVVQCREISDGVYEATIRDEVQRLDNVPYDDNAVIDIKPRRNRKCKPE